MTKRDKTALVTGAAQGIGQAIALELARDGVQHLILVDRNGGELEAVANDIRSHFTNVTVTPLVGDLTEIEQVTSDLTPILARAGRIDIVVNAAGLTTRGGLDDATVADFDRLFAVNTRAPLFLIQAVRPWLGQGSVVVNVASMLAYGGPPFLLAYSASKAALVTLTKGIANTLKWDGIHVFGVNLGWTLTPNEHEVQTKIHGLPESWARDVGDRQPFGRLLMPEDVSGLVSFLTSARASMMTGAIIDLDQFVAGTVDDNPGNAN